MLELLLGSFMRTGIRNTRSLWQKLSFTIIFLLNISLTNVFAAVIWTEATVDQGREFANFRQANSIALEKVSQYPHIVYGGKGLYHAWKDGSVWHTETIFSAANITSAAIVLDSANKVHIVCFNAATGRLQYVSNTSGSWQTTALDAAAVSDFSMAIDSADRLLLSYAAVVNGDQALKFGYKLPLAPDWTMAVIDAQAGQQLGTESSIAVDSLNQVHISYHDSSAKTLKYANNVSGWQIATLGDSGSTGRYSSITVGIDSNIHISYYETGNQQLRYATAPGSNGPWSFAGITVAGNHQLAGRTTIGLDLSGFVHVFFADTTSKLLRTSKTTGSWVEDVLLDGSAGTSVNSSTAAVISPTLNTLHVSNTKTSLTYLDSTAAQVGSWNNTQVDTGGDVGLTPNFMLNIYNQQEIVYGAGGARMATKSGGGNWNISNLNLPNLSAAALDSSNFLHVAYSDAAAGSKVTYANNTQGNLSPVQVDSVGDNTQPLLALDSLGRPHLAFSRLTGGSNRLMYASFNGSVWSVQTADSSPESLAGSLTVDANGFAHISCYDKAQEDLKYASNASGSWETVTLDSSGNVGGQSSIALDTGGKVHISYSDSTFPDNRQLKYATNASGYWVTETVLSGLADYDVESSLTIDANGVVHIAFVSGTTLGHTMKTGGSWVTTSPAGGLSGNVQPSIRVGGDRTTHIAFHDSANYALRYASIPGAELSVGKYGGGHGTVTTDTGSLTWFNAITAVANYAGGTVVTLTATPDPGFVFLGWSGPCSGTGSCTVTMDQQQNVGVNIAFGVNGSCGDSVNGLHTEPPSTNLCIDGYPNEVTGSGPWQWQCVGDGAGTTATCNANVPAYGVNFSAVPANGGTFSGAVSQTVNHGAAATPVRAVAAEGFQFLNWSGTNGFINSAVNPLTVQPVTVAMDITANFLPARINGSCGSANGSSLTEVPGANLCTSGQASAVYGSGPWGWSCGGQYGGLPATCSAVVAGTSGSAVLDTMFNPFVTGGTIYSLAVQKDGRILVSGDFGSNRLHRLHADGTLDGTLSFTASNPVITALPLANGKTLVGGVAPVLYLLGADGNIDPGFQNFPFDGFINVLLQQPDGWILVGGSTTMANLVRLTPYGAPDFSFHAEINGEVTSLLYQPDNKVLVGGLFTTVNGRQLPGLARLNYDGTLDDSFAPPPTLPAGVVALALQADGKILVTGNFDTVYRLNSDGTQDQSFTVTVAGGAATVKSLAVQGNGNILISGEFASVNGVPRSGLARLTPAGALDTTFDLPVINGTFGIMAIALQPDGSILLGGDFSSVSGTTLPGLARITDTAPLNAAIAVADDGSSVALLSGSTGPALHQVSFEGSTNGTDWTVMGNGIAIPGGWQLTGTAIPVQLNYQIRASGSMPSGSYTSSISQLQTAGTFFLPQTSASYTVTPSINGSGYISSAGPVTASAGSLVVFNTVADQGFTLTAVGGTCGATIQGTQIATPPLSADCTVQAIFAPITYPVIPTVAPSGGGTISPATIQQVAYGSSATFTITPDGDNRVADVSGCGGIWSGPITGGSYVTGSISGPCTVTATFTSPFSSAMPVMAMVFQPDGKLLLTTNDSQVSRLSASGWPDAGFNNMQLWGGVSSLAVQADGHFLVGGSFQESYVSGDYSPPYLARFANDGVLDSLFRPVFNGGISGIALPPPDRTLVTGVTANNFTASVAELNPLYALQPEPQPDASIVTSVLLRDNRILVGGQFIQINGTPRAYIARLESSGAVDMSYDPGADSFVNVLLLQPDGKVLVGGDFQVIAGWSQPYLARLNADGTLDTDFTPVLNGQVWGINLQTDGRIHISGNFLTVNGQARPYAARLNADGSLDTAFAPAPDGAIMATALKQDGSLLLSGNFFTIAGSYQPYMVRFPADAPVTEQIVAAGNGSSLALLRSGPGPEYHSVTFEVSADNSNWSYLGSATPVGGGWQLGGLSLPTGQSHFIRARGGAPVNNYSGSSWSLYETVQQVTLPATPATYTVTVTVTGTGTVSTGGDLSVIDSGMASIDLFPFTGSHVGAVTGTCGGNLLGQQLFTTLPVSANCTVNVQFSKNVYPVNFAAGPHGTLSGTTTQMVEYDSPTAPVEAVADPHYHFVNWTSDGMFTSTANPLTIGAVVSRMNLTANFSVDTFTVTPTAGANGSIYPATPQQVGYGSVFSFRPHADSGFAFSSAGGDCPAGSYNPATGIYSTGIITAACSVTADFSASSADTSKALISWGSRVLDARTAGRFKAIGAGFANSFGVLENGTLQAWGSNSNGESTIPAGLTDVVAVSGGQIFGLALKGDGTVAAWGTGSSTFVPNSLGPVTAISAHSYHAMALQQNGVVVSWGGEEWGRLNGADGAANVKGIAAGGFFSATLGTNGVVTSYIDVEQGELPDVFGAEKIAGGRCHVLALMPDGTVRSTLAATPQFLNVLGDFAFCSRAAFLANMPSGLTNVTAIATGDFHNVVLKGDGTVVTWGDNSLGQLNVPPGLTNVVAIAANGDFTVALKADGSTVAWGDNSQGQSLDLARLGRLKTATSGYGHSLGIADDGKLLTWGDNSYGQAPNAGLVDLVAVAAGQNHSLALQKDGTVLAWGDNSAGETTVPVMAPVVSIAAGASQSLALTSAGTVVAWGSATAPPADLSGVVAIAAGNLHALALKSDGTVVAWGDNSIGQATVPAGLVDVKAISAGYNTSVALKGDGTVVVWGIENAAHPSDLNNAIAIATGPGHILATRNDNSVIAWGPNISGQTVVPAGVAGLVALSGNGYSQVLSPKFNVAISVVTGHGQTSPVLSAKGSAGVRFPITLIPDTGYHVDKVEGTCGGTLNGNLFTTNPLQADCTVAVSYAINTYQVTFAVEGNGTLQGTVTQTVIHGEAATAVEALPGIGHHLVNWTAAGGFASTDNPLTVTNVTGPMTVTAHFTINIYTVTFADGANGTIAGTKVQLVPHGSSAAAVTAVPDPSYQFDYWSGSNGFVDSPNNPLQVVNVTGDLTVTPHFIQKLVRVTPWMTGAGLMFPSAVQQVVKGNVATFMLFPANGSIFGSAGGSCPVGSYDAVNHIYATGTLTADCVVIINFQDVTNPVLSSFSLPSTVTSMTVPVSTLTASDNVAVSGYLITRSATPPAANDPGWTAQAPAETTLPSAESTTFYAWVKDATGKISNTLSAPVQLLLSRCVNSNQYFQTIQEAYNAAADTETINTLRLGDSVTVVGDLNANRNVTITVQGGYSDGYGAQTGITVIRGALKVTAGTLIVNGLAVQ